MAKKRTKSICLRLSNEEHQVLSEKARAAGLSVSGLLRDHVSRVRVYNHKEQQQWVAILLSLRKHLTALAEKVVGFGPADAVVAIAYLAAIARHLERLGSQERKYAHQIFPSRDGQQ
jgi:post-segregation antitoxin (ccd killing protein)